jgi:hypothetical protein
MNMAFRWVGIYGNRMAANQASRRASNASTEARSASSRVRELEDALARQALVIQTLLNVCEQKGMFTADEFMAMMDEIDASDGYVDGKFTPQRGPRDCPSCMKRNTRNAVSCIYCGTMLPREDIL